MAKIEHGKSCSCLKTDFELKEHQKELARTYGMKGHKKLVDSIPDTIPETDEAKLAAFASALNWNHTFKVSRELCVGNKDKNEDEVSQAIVAQLCAVQVLFKLGMNELANSLDIYTGGCATEHIASLRISKYSRKMSQGKGDSIPSMKGDISKILEKDPKLTAKTIIKRLESIGYEVTDNENLYYRENDGHVSLKHFQNVVSRLKKDLNSK